MKQSRLSCRITAILFASAALLAYADSKEITMSSGQSRKTVHYEPEVVTLEGIISIEMKYGPPNYGEDPNNDLRLFVAYLRLHYPINVISDGNSDVNIQSFLSVSELQIIRSTDLDLSEFIDKPVVIEGTISQGISGHHYSDLLVKVESIKLEKYSGSVQPVTEY